MNTGGVWSVLATFAAMVGLWMFWAIVVVVIPGIIAVYVSMLFPLTGQWRKKWSQRKASRKDRVGL